MTRDLDWFPELPVGWHCMPLKAVCDYRVSNVDKVPADGELPVRLCNYTDVYHNEFIRVDMDLMQTTATQAEIDRFGLTVDDVVITKDSETWDDIGVPAVIAESAPDLVCGYHLAMLRPNVSMLDGRYLFRCLQARPMQFQFERTATGVTRFGLGLDAIGRLYLPVPPLPRQRAIAAYLDRETAKIDAMIAAKEQLLTILAEKRRALITHAVTCGLNPEAPMKDSGVEWLGELPKHWSLSKFTWTVFIAEGQVDPEQEPFRSMMLMAPNHIESGTGRLVGRETAAEQSAISGKYFCRKGDIVYSKIRPALRKAAQAPEDCLCSADMYPLRPIGDLLAEYLLYFLLGDRFSTWAVLESQRVAMPKINREAISAIRIPVPPQQEQREIVDAMRLATSRMDKLSEAAGKSMKLLAERRASLIAAAVTGVLDVETAA